MIRVIIADDEVRVGQLIAKLIDWSSLDIKIIGQADNGISAYKMICAEKPEIVITDIRMPGLEGLDMIKKVREQKINTSFIIISGHKHFEYAQSAVKYGVEDYILKPINKEELTSILIKIRDRYDENNDKISAEKMIKQQLAISIDKLRKQYLLDLLTDKNQADEDIEKINKEYGYKFKKGCFQGVTFKIDKVNNESIDENHEKIVFDKIISIIKNCINAKFIEYEIIKIMGRIILIVNYKENESELFLKSIKCVFNESKEYIDIYNYFHLTLGIGTSEASLANLKKSVNKSLESLKCRLIAGFDKILNISDYSYPQINLDEVINNDNANAFNNMVEVFDINGLKEWLEGIFKIVSKKAKINPMVIYSISDFIVDMFFNTIRKINLENDNNNLLRKEIDKKVDNSTSINEIKETLFKFFKEYIETKAEYKKNQVNKPIRIAKQYIAENYKELISLDDIANIVHLNPVYFSVIFKKEVGMNFSDYIINYRLQASKELLKDLKYSIYQIADIVGYKDAKYFSKLFNKIVGIKPSEYRKLYS